MGAYGDHSDGSAFYRYSDGSEYYRRKSGRITFRPPEDPPEKLEEADPAAAPAPTVADKHWRAWYDWPPQLNLSVETRGSSIIIHDASGSTVTFEPAGTKAEVDLAPVHNKFVSLHRARDEGRFNLIPPIR